MSYCDCKICQSQLEKPERPIKQHYVTVKMVASGYWAVKSGSTWVEIRGTLDMSLDDVRNKVFTELDDVRAHPNSKHFER